MRRHHHRVRHAAGTAGSNTTTTGSGQSQPVDIQAAEQEFLGDRVAKGAVRVVYKDSVITGPEATLFKDANGQDAARYFYRTSTSGSNSKQDGCRHAYF